MIDGFIGIMRLFKHGTVDISKKHPFFIWVYILAGALMLLALSATALTAFLVGLLIMFITSFVLGIGYYFVYIYPDVKTRGFFNRLFIDIDLKTKNGHPEYLSKSEHQFVTVYSFQCRSPLKDWLAKKDDLEMGIKKRIVDIIQNEKELDIISVLAEKKPLSARIPWNDHYISDDNTLKIGASHYGIIGMDLDKHPHAFIAGETGSGKSNILKCMIHQALYKGYEVVLIDFKRGVSFAEFSDEVSIYYEYKDVMAVLRDMVLETINRLDKYRAVKVDNFQDYNRIANENDKLTMKIIFIDELAELLKTRDKEISSILHESLETLTRLSRAVGIHLIMAIQRPDSTVVGGQIKNNVSYRVCGRFVDKEPSQIMLNNHTATTLPNIKGRFIVKDDEVRIVQGFYYQGSVVIPDNQPADDPVVEIAPPEPMTEAEESEPTTQSELPDAGNIPEEPSKEPTPIDEYDFNFDLNEFR